MKKITTIISFIGGLGGMRGLRGTMAYTKHMGACQFFILSFFHFFIFVSCTQDMDFLDEEKEVFIRVMGYENEYVEVDAVTRATVSWQPSGYQESHEYVSYGIFFTKSNSNDVIKTKFRYGADNKWYMVGEVPAGEYYLYGYMPYDAGEVTIDPPSGGTYADGAVMTFRNLNAAMTKDLCIITSAKDATRNKADDWTEESPKYTYVLGNGLTWLPLADFKCNIKAGEGDENKNTLFFLFDHLYAALHLSFRVDETYNQLRDIVIKRLELESYKDEACEHLMPKLMTTITLMANDDKTTSPIVGDVVFSEDEGAGVMEKVLIFNKADAVWPDDRLPSLDAENNKVYVEKSGYIPKSGTENFYKLTTTYDIYDKKGNLIRKGQTAVNVLNPKTLFSQPQLLRGYKYTLRMTIAPTFLYQMSDEDLEFTFDIEH